MTLPYSPTAQWQAEDMVTVAIDQLATELAALRALSARQTAAPLDSDDVALLVDVHAATVRVLAAAEVTVRRQALLRKRAA